MRELIFISKIITIIKVGVDFAINFIYLFKYKESFCYLLAEGAICPWLAEHPPVRKHSRGTPNSSVGHKARK